MPKPIFYILVVIVVAIAVVYFYQKRTAEQLLDSLVEKGTITISEKIEALPIFIVDNNNKSIHLLAGNKHQAIAFVDIKVINLYKAHDRGNNAGGKIGPDYGTITTQDDKRFRFDNLAITAEVLNKSLMQYPELASKLKLNND